MFACAEVKAMILGRMTKSQYYCERCDRAFEYNHCKQNQCEQCGATIQNNNIAEAD